MDKAFKIIVIVLLLTANVFLFFIFKHLYLI